MFYWNYGTCSRCRKYFIYRDGNDGILVKVRLFRVTA